MKQVWSNYEVLTVTAFVALHKINKISIYRAVVIMSVLLYNRSFASIYSKFQRIRKQEAFTGGDLSE